MLANMKENVFQGKSFKFHQLKEGKRDVVEIGEAGN